MSIKLRLDGKVVTSDQAARLITIKVAKAAMQVVTRAAIRLGQDIQDWTPVKTGRAALNWSVTLNGFVPMYDASLAGTGREAIRTVIPGQVGLKDVLTIVNPTPYILELEYGSSDQAPAGMIRLHTSNWPNYVARAQRGAI